MANEKIIIAFAGEKTVIDLLKTKIHEFVSEHCRKKNQALPESSINSDDSEKECILKDFSFEGFSFVVKVLDLAAVDRQDTTEAKTNLFAYNVTKANGTLSNETFRFTAASFGDVSDASFLAKEAFLKAMQPPIPQLVAKLPTKPEALLARPEAVDPEPSKKTPIWPVLGVLFSLLAAASLITLGLTGLLLTAYLVLPIAFLVLTMAAIIKTARDHHSREATFFLVDNPSNDQNPTGAVSPKANAQQQEYLSEKALWKQEKKLDFGDLLVQKDGSISPYQPLRELENLGEKPLAYEDIFKTEPQYERRLGKWVNPMCIDVVKSMLHLVVTGRFEIPLCKENAPFIEEMMNKNSSGVFRENKKATKLQEEIISERRRSLQNSIPERLLEPIKTGSSLES